MADAPARSRTPVPDPAAPHGSATAHVLDRRQGRRAALPALPGLRLLQPPAHADLPDRATRRTCSAEAVSGRATLFTYTVNHQPWMPGPELPYIVAIVAIPEQDGLRLTTNLVDVAPDDVEIGMDARGDVREPRRRGVDPAVPARGGRREQVDPNLVIERRAMISGVGQSDIGRRLVPRPARAHPRRVPRRDRGRRAHHEGHRRRRHVPGPDGDVRPASRGRASSTCTTRCASSSAGGPAASSRPGQLGSVINACLAVASGLATHVLCFRSVCEGSAQGDKGRAAVSRVRGGERGLPGQSASWSGRCRSPRRRPRSGSR